MQQPAPDTGHPYYQTTACLLSKHKKHQVIAPVLAKVLAVELRVDEDFDTDTLGNFTRTIARVEDQRATAERKARLAASRSGLNIGIGSEGSFDTQALGGLACLNTEILVWFDASRDMTISAQHQTVLSVTTLITDDFAELEKYALQSGFPEQALVLRADDERDPQPITGIGSSEALEQAFVACLARSGGNQVFAEWDFRAHCCPSRMQTIARAAQQLAEHVLRLCPQCHTPGYQPVSAEQGLPCQQCQAPTTMSKGRYFRCGVCQTSHFEPVSEPFADPFHCSICNP
ncbi:DUF6671 family protein [Lacimicrobium sp. SS2-24]|uniref:DUF6671 family protein n=1 Tax=Lacimicrobium sp. SS2-24 TaxID=2005569 RepID=UPI000B4AEC2C|nr:DUF6671 family protein [Lacimicrobium sp. SS2-24]